MFLIIFANNQNEEKMKENEHKKGSHHGRQ